MRNISPSKVVKINASVIKLLLCSIVFFAFNSKTLAQGYVTIGTQSAQSGNFNSSPVNGYYESRKIQIIYTAAEIAAAGGAAGNIQRLAWDVATVYAGDPGGLPGYTIQMGHIATTSIPTTSFVTGLTIVKTAFSYLPSIGFNDITFNTPFNWNGTDNVLIEICFNPAPFDFSTDLHGESWNYTGVSNSYIEAEADGADQCPETVSMTQTDSKPRIRFYMQQAVVTCSTPTSFTAYNLTSTTTALSWTNPSTGTPASYQVEIRTSGAAGSGATGFVTSTTITHPTNLTTITGLTANTSYSAYIRTDCGGASYSLYSSAVNFTTPCAASSVPYTQNFDGATLPNLPSCTSRQDLNATTTWATVTAPASYTGKILQYNYDLGGNPANDWFYTNGINLTAGTSYRLMYKYGARNPAFPERLEVFYGNTAISTSMTTSLTNHSNITTVSNLGKIDFVPSASGIYFFGFHAYSLGSMDLMYLDDISVTVTPICYDITNTNVYGFSTTSAILSWTPASLGSPAAYQVELRTSGAAGSGATGLVSTTTITHPGSITTFTGLTAATSYTAFIRTDCSIGDYSNWTPVVFSTPCNAVNIPYVQNFDAATTPNLPSCTYKQDLNGGSNWQTTTAPSSYSGNVLRYATDAVNTGNDWFYTSGLNLSSGTTYRLTFKYGNSSASLVEKLEVKYGTSNSTETMNTALLNFSSITGNTPNNASIDFSPSSSGVFYIGFKSYSAANQSQLYLDDISVIVAPVCASPTSLNISGLSGTSASLSWSPPGVGIPLNYLVELRTSGAGGSGSTGLVTTLNVTHPTTTATFTGLTLSTSYTAFIKTDCGSGDYGAWVASNLFSTTCAPTSVPYSENFNTTTYPNIPTCTYKQAIGQGSWYVFNASVMSFPDFTDECLFFEYNGANTADNWFYTSGMNMIGGITYKLSYKYRSDVAGQTKMMVSYGNSPVATTMVNTLSNHTSISATTNVTTISFTPSSSGVYYIGFNGYGIGNAHFILIEDILVNSDPLNTNSSLSDLTSSVGLLDPSFDPATFNYIVDLPFGSTGSATITPTTAEVTATTSITNATNVAGTSPSNVASVVVTAQSGASSTYTVTYNVAPANSNTSLSSLTTSVGTLSPSFNGSTLNYTVNLPFGSTGGASLTAFTAAGTSTVSVTNALNVAGGPPINIATAVVTAQNGATATYTVTYSVAPASSDATLASLSTSIGTLDPAFDPNTNTYSVVLPEGTTGGATISGVVNNANASITSTTSAVDVNGSGSDNIATIVVTAQDGSTRTYTVIYSVISGVADRFAEKISVKIFPNPTSGITTLKAEGLSSRSIKVTVVSIAGQLINEQEINISGAELSYQIDLSKEPKGVYFIKVQDDKSKTQIIKAVKF